MLPHSVCSTVCAPQYVARPSGPCLPVLGVPLQVDRCVQHANAPQPRPATPVYIRVHEPGAAPACPCHADCVVPRRFVCRPCLPVPRRLCGARTQRRARRYHGLATHGGGAACRCGGACRCGAAGWARRRSRSARPGRSRAAGGAWGQQRAGVRESAHSCRLCLFVCVECVQMHVHVLGRGCVRACVGGWVGAQTRAGVCICMCICTTVGRCLHMGGCMEGLPGVCRGRLACCWACAPACVRPQRLRCKQQVACRAATREATLLHVPMKDKGRVGAALHIAPCSHALVLWRASCLLVLHQAGVGSAPAAGERARQGPAQTQTGTQTCARALDTPLRAQAPAPAHVSARARAHGPA